jgi:uncharacterized damage-inducible protein DinB
MTPQTSPGTDRERADLIEVLARHREFLRFTVQGLTVEQASASPTASALTLAGILKHVSDTESLWVDFIERGPEAFGPARQWGEEGVDQPWEGHGDVTGGDDDEHGGDGGGDAVGWTDPRFVVPEGTSVDDLLEAYAAVARRTEDLVRAHPDLDADHPLPSAPWFERGARWSARRVLLHVLAETSQHAGHADILRESLDGQKTMG